MRARFAASPALLTAILLGLVVLLVRDFQRGSDSRYRITTLGFAKPELIRVDVRNGDAWRLDESEGTRRWVPLSDVPPLARGMAPSSTSPGPGGQAGRVNESSVRTLAEPSAEDIRIFIDTLLGDELPGEVRAWTAQQLSGIDTPEVTDALLQGLNDPNPEVVAACATVLAKRRDPRVRAAFEALRESSDTPARQAAPNRRVETLD